MDMQKGCRMNRLTSDVYLKVEGALDEEQERKFLEAFVALNPHWRGAHVADVLAELDSRDAHLDITERLYEEHEDEWTPAHAPAAIVLVYLNASVPSWDDVDKLARTAYRGRGEDEVSRL